MELARDPMPCVIINTLNAEPRNCGWHLEAHHHSATLEDIVILSIISVRTSYWLIEGTKVDPWEWELSIVGAEGPALLLGGLLILSWAPCDELSLVLTTPPI
jgi:hypothetical protein